MSSPYTPVPNPELKADIIKKLNIEPVAFLRPLSSAKPPVDARRTAGTHLLAWRRGGLNDELLYDEKVIDELVEYIRALEVQLALDAEAFRERSIRHLVTNRTLHGFDPV